MAQAKPTGEQELEAEREEDTVEYDLNERTRHELIRGAVTDVLTLIKIGFWVGVGFCIAGMVFWLLAMLILWAIFGSMIQSKPWN